MHNGYTWGIVAVISFLAGIVSNIVRPTRRGVIGFIASGIVSVFCGTVVAICTDFEIERQVLVAALVGVSADRVLTYLLNFTIQQKIYNETNISNWGHGSNVAGSNEGKQDAKIDREPEEST